MKSTEVQATILQIYESSSGLRLANFRQHAFVLPANSIFLTRGDTQFRFGFVANDQSSFIWTGSVHAQNIPKRDRH